MKRLFKNKKIRYLLMVVILIVLVAGCTKITDDKGVILEEKIIFLSTTFGEMMKNEGWFNGLLVWPVAFLINYLTPLLGVGAAIVAVTVGVNVLTFGLTVQSTISSQKMQIVQPELTKIQEKYRDKKDQPSQMKMANEMNALYAKHGIKPFGAILNLFIQIPIMIAMYQAVQRAEAVVHAKFMGVELVNSPAWGFKNQTYILVIIFVLMIVTQFLSMKLPQMLAKKRQEKIRKGRPDEKPPANPQAAMTYGMLAMIGFLAVNWPTAMSLYWMITSIVNIAKTYFIQWRYIDHEKV